MGDKCNVLILSPVSYTHLDVYKRQELESNGTKTTIENKKRVKHPNNPYCRVIIDNREGYQIVAIEKNAAFSGDTDLSLIHIFSKM